MSEPVAVVLIVGACLLGAIVGSFLTVVVHRVPAGVSIVRPGSACVQCGASVSPRDNIPLVSWMLLGGRCRSCGARVSASYPLIEASTAVAFGLLAWWFTGEEGPLSSLTGGPAWWIVPASALLGASFLWLAAASIALTAIDLSTHRLPDPIVLPGYAVAALGLALPAIVAGQGERAGRAALGALLLFLAYAVLALAWPGGMGAGDVKLAGVLGAFLAWIGWAPFVVGAFAAFVLGGLVSIALLIARRASLSSGIPFGPWMLAGAWVGVLAGQPIAATYLSLFGITEV